VLQALDHPDVYVAAMSLSGALHEPLVPGDPREQPFSDFFGNAFGTPFNTERFNAINPFTRAKSLLSITSRPAFYLTIGDSDFPDLVQASKDFHRLLKGMDTDSTLRLGKGRHAWETWQTAIIPALQWLAPRLDARCGKT
jgi:enterochelin esterase family protein